MDKDRLEILEKLYYEETSMYYSEEDVDHTWLYGKGYIIETGFEEMKITSKGISYVEDSLHPFKTFWNRYWQWIIGVLFVGLTVPGIMLLIFLFSSVATKDLICTPVFGTDTFICKSQ